MYRAAGYPFFGHMVILSNRMKETLFLGLDSETDEKE